MGFEDISLWRLTTLVSFSCGWVSQISMISLRNSSLSDDDGCGTPNFHVITVALLGMPISDLTTGWNF